MTRLSLLALAILLGLLAGCEIGTEPAPSAESSGRHAAAGDTPGRNDRWVAATHRQGPARGQLRFIDGFAAGYTKAIREQKPMLVFFTAEWCRYCHQMADDAFRNDQVINLSERFVCILIDADDEPNVCRQFQVESFPTIQFLSPRGEALNRVVGKQPGPQLMMAMQIALQNVARGAEYPAQNLR
jgi:thioredoxin-like negative regulator of GroEL